MKKVWLFVACVILAVLCSFSVFGSEQKTEQYEEDFDTVNVGNFAGTAFANDWSFSSPFGGSSVIDEGGNHYVRLEHYAQLQSNNIIDDGNGYEFSLKFRRNSNTNGNMGLAGFFVRAVAPVTRNGRNMEFYEDNGTGYIGGSGIVVFPCADKIRIAIITYVPGGYNVNLAYHDFEYPEGTNGTTFLTYTIKDNGSDTVGIYADGQLLTNIELSNKGSYEEASEDTNVYYKSAVLKDGNGIILELYDASNQKLYAINNAMIGTGYYTAFGCRGSTYDIDDVVVSKVTDFATEPLPTTMVVVQNENFGTTELGNFGGTAFANNWSFSSPFGGSSVLDEGGNHFARLESFAQLQSNNIIDDGNGYEFSLKFRRNSNTNGNMGLAGFFVRAVTPVMQNGRNMEFYEDNGTGYIGGSGIVVFPCADKIRIAIITYVPGGYNVNLAYHDFEYPEGTNGTTFLTYTIKDNGSDTVGIYADGQLLTNVELSNKGSYEEASEDTNVYYKSAVMKDGNGIILELYDASNQKLYAINNAMIGTGYYTAFGCRGSTYDIDDVSVLAVEEIVPTTMFVQPELKESITMHYTVQLGSDVSGVPVMNFEYRGQNIVAQAISLGNNAYQFALEEILPQHMGSPINAYVMVDGTEVIRNEGYSVRQYCLNQLEKTTDANLKALVIALLNYGTQAQSYFGDMDTAVNEGVNQQILTDYLLGKSYDVATPGGCIDTPVTGNNDGDYIWKAATLGLYDTVNVRVKFQAASIEGLSVIVNGQRYTEFVSAGKDLWYIYIPVFAADFADSLVLTFENESGAVGAMLTYSVNTYVKYVMDNSLDAVQPLVEAIYYYGILAAERV